MNNQQDFSVKTRPHITLFSEFQRQKIHSAVLDLLENTGVKILASEAREVLEGAGVKITEQNLAKIPSYLVKKALRSAPERVMISDRNGEEAMTLERHNTYFGTGSDLQYTVDPFTGKRRRSKKKDIGNAALICDYLENIDFVMSMGLASDVKESLADRHHFQKMVSNTSKPIIFTAWGLQGLKDIYKMAVEVTGSREELEKNPFILHYAEPSTPLRHSKEALQKLLFCAENRLPLIYISAPAMGGTAPVTVAGATVLSMAEFLSGLVIAQLKNEGAPVICGGGSSPLDMKTSTFSYAAPENWLSEIAIKEMSSFYGVPVFGEGGVSDAKSFDQQAALENAITLILVGLGGTNLIHDVGYIESGYTASYESIVLGNEVIGELKRFLKGVDVSEESLATQVIDEVGPGGNFLTEEHTMKRFKSEVWEPQYLNRENYEAWDKSGRMNLGDRLNEEVRRILDEYQPASLEGEKRNRLEEIVKEAEANRRKD